jgi:hypothetical protein
VLTTLYTSYLLALLLLPLLVYWRRGLPASLLVTGAELGLALVAGIAMLPPARPIGPLPERNVLEHLMQAHREGFAEAVVALVTWIAIPGLAALLGGGLALAWSGILAMRRSLAKRRSVSP